MNQEKAWQQFVGLSSEAQQQVVDFMASMQAQYAPPVDRKTADRTKLASNVFIEMWRDREDMNDSRAWVRKTREREWTNRHA